MHLRQLVNSRCLIGPQQIRCFMSMKTCLLVSSLLLVIAIESWGFTQMPMLRSVTSLPRICEMRKYPVHNLHGSVTLDRYCCISNNHRKFHFAQLSPHSEVDNSPPSRYLYPSTWFTALSIIALVLQNSGLSLSMRLSRIKKPGSSLVMYSTSTAVLVAEILKFIISYVIYHTTDRGNTKRSFKEIITDLPILIDVAIPSTLYVMQNNLQYLAMSSLPAAIYQVLVQMKIITAAFLSQIYLQKPISKRQWLSIIALTLGVVVVQLSMVSNAVSRNNLNIPLGLVAVGLSCITSGYAGVKLESTLKDTRESLWVRNLQIAIVSVVIAGLMCLKDARNLWYNGFFYGYSPLVLMVILIQAVGGILVSLVVKYTNTIVKGFATAASIIVTTLISAYVVRDVKINANFVFGTIVVCLSTLVYSIK